MPFKMLNQNSNTSPNCQINLRKSPMIWKDYLKLSENASYSKLARASKAPPPRNRVKTLPFVHEGRSLLDIFTVDIVLLFPHPFDLQKKTPNELKPSFHMIAHDRRIAENAARDRQRLYGNTFKEFSDRQRSRTLR